ncbi:MAG: hypothetical protein NTY23_04165 [Chloroflexi bacterium]|nr:hypothetical protein [Chloroflexota bacterium]
MDVIDIAQTLVLLGHSRPIFHSEADFQDALGWHLHSACPSATIRLEMPVSLLTEVAHIDLWVVQDGVPYAIELKYKTRDFAFIWEGESFRLKDQIAQDIGRYDFLKDCWRVEQVVSAQPLSFGFAILLTNDTGYWNPPQQSDTVEAAFRLHEGRSVSGDLAWSPRASAGTIKGREGSIHLTGLYTLHWADYSTLRTTGYSTFRYLCLDVRKGLEAA